MVLFLLQNTHFWSVPQTKSSCGLKRHGVQSHLHIPCCFQQKDGLQDSSQNSCLSFSSPTAANQKEALKGPFCVKEEPQADEPLSSQRGPSYSFCQEGPPGSTKPREEGSPMLGKSSLLSQDINVKVASELLMKLSGQQMYFGACTHICVCHFRLEFMNAFEETQRPED